MSAQDSVDGATVPSTVDVSTAAELASALAAATAGTTILLSSGQYGDLNLYDQKNPLCAFLQVRSQSSLPMPTIRLLLAMSLLMGFTILLSIDQIRLRFCFWSSYLYGSVCDNIIQLI